MEVTASRRTAALTLEKEREIADYEARIRALIESIDWTRAESRVRFPVEHDRITAEHRAALLRLSE